MTTQTQTEVVQVLRRYGFIMVMAVAVFGALAWAEVTIDFWHAMSKRHGPVLETLVQEFMEENPGITVNLVYQGG